MSRLSFGRSRSVGFTKSLKDGQKHFDFKCVSGKLECVEKKEQKPGDCRVSLSAEEDQMRQTDESSSVVIFCVVIFCVVIYKVSIKGGC